MQYAAWLNRFTFDIAAFQPALPGTNGYRWSVDLTAADVRIANNSMGLSDLDGFLTGIVVGPELILPSQWLPVIWGGEEPEFATEKQMRIILGTIMGRYNEIVACFNNDADEFDPIFWKGPEGDVIVSDWAAGFLDAVALRSDAWKALTDDDSAWKLIVPFQLLNGDLEFADDSARKRSKPRHLIWSSLASKASARLLGAEGECVVTGQTDTANHSHNPSSRTRAVTSSL